MDSQREELNKQVDPYRNTLVIDQMVFEVVLLEGVTEIPQDDFYWMFRSFKEGQYLSSCVMNFIPLKGIINDEDYYRMKNMFNLTYRE